MIARVARSLAHPFSLLLLPPAPPPPWQYVLLNGSVHCQSHASDKSREIDVVFGPGSSFGEGALITAVRREADVTALEPVDLPDAIVERYANATIAITGYEVDVVRGGGANASADELVSVPSYESCACVRWVRHPSFS